MAALRSTDFLPKRFQGDSIDGDLARAHFLAFTDYLEAHGLDNPLDDEEFQAVVAIFKRTLHGTARIWIEGKAFQNIANLRSSFLARFSESSSHYALTRQFSELKYSQGDTAEAFLASIRKLALLLNYTELQVRDKFLNALPSECRSAVLMSTDRDADMDVLVEKVQCFFDLQKYPEPENSTKIKTSVPSDSAFSIEDKHSQSADIADLCNKVDSLLNSQARRPASQGDTSSPRQHHNSRDGRRRAPNRPNQSGNRLPFAGVCYYCNTPGHRSRDCFLRRHHQQVQYRPQYRPPSFPPPFMPPPQGQNFQ